MVDVNYAVIIPAHNEAGIIERTLQSLARQVDINGRIIVVCNGCTDDTAAICRKFDPAVETIEIPESSKTAALNTGEKHSDADFRIYLDADVVLTDGTLYRLLSTLASGTLLAVSTQPHMDFDDSSWAVKAYYDVWLSLPYCKKGLIGSGLYALSRRGRERFDSFPDVVADDGFVRALFREHERGMVKDAYSILRAPANLKWLIKIKTRSRLGEIELGSRFPQLIENTEKDYSKGFWDIAKNPSKWLAAVVYLYVNLLTRYLARRRFANLAAYKWERDLSSRKGASHQ